MKFVKYFIIFIWWVFAIIMGVITLTSSLIPEWHALRYISMLYTVTMTVLVIDQFKKWFNQEIQTKQGKVK